MWRSTVLDRVLGAGRYLLIGLTALAGGYAISNAFELWLDPGPQASAAAEATTAGGARERTRTPKPHRVHASVIFERNLFGTDEEATVTAVDDSPTQAPARLGFKLRGTAVVEGRGFAVFDDENGRI